MRQIFTPPMACSTTTRWLEIARFDAFFPNTDAFLREACVVFIGEEGEGAGGRLERLQRALSGGEPHLLVLDGLERVQSEGTAGRTRGDLEDHQVKNLLRSVASGLGRTRALVTSRFKLTDLEQ